MTRKVLAWFFLIGGLIGFTLSAFQIIGKSEPLLVLLLSWGALVIEGANSVFITHGEGDSEH